MSNYVAREIRVRCFDLKVFISHNVSTARVLVSHNTVTDEDPLKGLTAIYPLLNNVPVRSLTYGYIAHSMSFYNIINCEICNALGSSLHPPSRINHHTYRQRCAGAEAYSAYTDVTT